MSPVTTTAAQAAAWTEAALQGQVATICRDLGVRHYHTHNSVRSGAGWPDSVIGGPHGVLFRELKRETGKPTREQEGWLKNLRDTGHDADVWRPSDLLSGRIAREIAAIAYGPRAVTQ